MEVMVDGERIVRKTEEEGIMVKVEECLRKDIYSNNRRF